MALVETPGTFPVSAPAVVVEDVRIMSSASTLLIAVVTRLFD